MAVRLFKLMDNRNGISISYYALLFFISAFGWMPLYSPRFPEPGNYIAFIIQNVAFFSFFAAMDLKIKSGGVRYFLAIIGMWHAGRIIVDSILLSVLGISFIESARVLGYGCSFIGSLQDAGFPGWSIFFIPVAAIMLLLNACLFYRFLPVTEINNKRVGMFFCIIPVIFFGVFLAEQFYSRNSFSYHARREFPVYLQLFSTCENTLKIPLPKQPCKNKIDKFLAEIRAADNSRNVVFIMLESMRQDAVDSIVSPNIYSLAEEGIRFKGVYGDAIYTSLSWNVILMDSPAYLLENDIRTFNRESGSSINFRILKKCGYQTGVFSSADFHWNIFYERVKGCNDVIDKYYNGSREHPGLSRVQKDLKTTEEAIKWIRSEAVTGPFFLYLQMDSSHWAYYSGNNSKVFRPYSEDISIIRLKSPENKRLLHNRYRNSVREVDGNIGRIINALKRMGIYEKTAVVAVSDHGEGFEEGIIGHNVFNSHVNRPFMMMRLPGQEGRIIEGIVSHRDIFPTLFDYLRIKGVSKGFFIGKSALKLKKGDRPVLIIQGGCMLAELKMNDFTACLRMKIDGKNLFFTPFRYFDGGRKLLRTKRLAEYNELWQKAASDIIMKDDGRCGFKKI